MCVSALPVLAAEEPIINNDFEGGDASFSARGQVTLSVSSDAAYSGTKSLLVSGRGSNGWEGASLNVASSVKLDETYYGQMYVKAADEGASFTVKMSLELTDDTKTDYPQMATAKVNSNSWTLLEGSWKADYTGNLKTLNFNIETDDDGIGKSFYVDNVFFANESVQKPSAESSGEAVEPDKVISYSGNTIPEDIVNRDYKDIDKLMSLGVVNGYPDGSFGPDNPVTRAEFLTMLMRLLKMDKITAGASEYTDVPDTHFAKDTIALATSMGICNGYGDGLFGPEDHVTYAQAVKMLMSTMGYALMAEADGGYPNGYMSVANAEDIKVSGAVPIDADLTRAMTAELICSALDVDLYMKDGSGKIVRDYNKNLLTEYYKGDIIVNGYVEASNDAAISGGAAGIGSVRINGVNYLAGATRASELVGYYVEFIYSDINNDYTLLYIEPKSSKNDELIIDSRDIESYSNYEYKYYEGNRTKTARLDRDFTVIYNGQTVSGNYNDSMMTPELGSVRLVGSDSGRYSIADITSYETFVVASINKATGDVYDISNKKYTFEIADDTVSYIKPDGSEGSLADIRKDDVLHIAASANNDKTVVRIVRSTISGTVNSASYEDVTVDGIKYIFSDVYLNRNYERPNVSTDITAHLDINGDIVYIEDEGDTSMSIGYFVNAFIQDDGETLQMRYMTSDGDMITANIANSIIIDGVTYGSGDKTGKINALRGSGTTAQERIFRYTTNGSGAVRRVDFARAQRETLTDADKREGENTLYTLNDKYVKDDSQAKYTYKYSARTFVDENGSYASIAFSPKTIIFIVPDENSKSGYEDYEATNVSSLGYNEQYRVYAYKTTMDGITADYAVLVKNGTGATNLRSQTGYVVTDVFSGVNSDGETVPGFGVYMNGSEQSYMVQSQEIYDDAVEANDGEDIKRGDIVRFDTDSSGEVTNVIVDRGSGKFGDYYYSALGYIYFKDDGYAYFTTQRPTASMSYDDMTLIPIDNFDITVYSKKEKKAYSGVAEDIIDYTTDPINYSTVYITMNYENAKSLICVTDY